MRNRWRLTVTVLMVLFFMGSVTCPTALAQGGHKEVSIQLLALRFGTLGYTSTFALASLINKHSEWLKAAAVETKGTIVNARTLAEETGKRNNTVILNSLSVQNLAENGSPPFKTPYDRLRAISLAYRVAGSLVTLDPKIRKGQDLIGKRVGIGKRGSTSALWPEVVFKYGWEIWDELKSVQYLGYKESYDALRSGTLDAALFNPIIPGVAAPALKELVETVPAFHVMNIPRDVIEKARKKSGLPIYTASLPEKAVSSKQNAYDGYAFTIGWWADKDLPEDVAYEICRIISEYHKELWDYHVGMKGLTPEAMPLAAGEEKDFHPGAIKFYKEKGMAIGIR